MNKIEILGHQIINKNWKQIVDDVALGLIMIGAGIPIYTSEPVLNWVKTRGGVVMEKITGKGRVNLD